MSEIKKCAEMNPLNSWHRASSGSLQLPATGLHAKKHSTDAIYSTFQKLFRQKPPAPKSHSKTRSFGFALLDSSLRALLKENKGKKVFDLRGSKLKHSFDVHEKSCDLEQKLCGTHYFRRASSRLKLDAIPSDKSRSPDASRQIPTCKLQRKLCLRTTSRNLTHENNATLKLPSPANIQVKQTRFRDREARPKAKSFDGLRAQKFSTGGRGSEVD